MFLLTNYENRATELRCRCQLNTDRFQRLFWLRGLDAWIFKEQADTHTHTPKKNTWIWTNQNWWFTQLYEGFLIRAWMRMIWHAPQLRTLIIGMSTSYSPVHLGYTDAPHFQTHRKNQHIYSNLLYHEPLGKQPPSSGPWHNFANHHASWGGFKTNSELAPWIGGNFRGAWTIDD